MLLFKNAGTVKYKRFQKLRNSCSIVVTACLAKCDEVIIECEVEILQISLAQHSVACNWSADDKEDQKIQK